MDPGAHMSGTTFLGSHPGADTVPQKQTSDNLGHRGQTGPVAKAICLPHGGPALPAGPLIAFAAHNEPDPHLPQQTMIPAPLI